MTYPGADPELVSHLRCYATDCPLPGSSAAEGGTRFVCACHALAEPRAWRDVTAKLREQHHLLAHIADMRDPRSRLDWRARAEIMWQHYPEERPQPGESLQLYVYRMWLLLQFHVGVRKTKPGPLARQIDTWKALRARQEAAQGASPGMAMNGPMPLPIPLLPAPARPAEEQPA